MTTGQPQGRNITGLQVPTPPGRGIPPRSVFLDGNGRMDQGRPLPRRHRRTSNRSGFTLIEIVVSLLLVGIVASFSAVFLVSGVQNFFITRDAVAAAFRAEVALNRMALELQSISENGLPDLPVLDTSITYTSDDTNLPGTRKLEFKNGDLYLVVGATDYLLMGDVGNPQLTATYADMDNDGSDEVAYIDISFTVGVMPAFNLRVFPRNMVPKPGT